METSRWGEGVRDVRGGLDRGGERVERVLREEMGGGGGGRGGGGGGRRKN